MSNSGNDLCTFCNLELVYEILKFVRSNCIKVDGVHVVVIPRPEVSQMFNTSLEDFDYHCGLLAKEGYFSYAPYGDPYPVETINCDVHIYGIALKAELLFQDVRRILNKP